MKDKLLQLMRLLCYVLLLARKLTHKRAHTTSCLLLDGLAFSATALKQDASKVVVITF